MSMELEPFFAGFHVPKTNRSILISRGQDFANRAAEGNCLDASVIGPLHVVQSKGFNAGDFGRIQETEPKQLGRAKQFKREAQASGARKGKLGKAERRLRSRNGFKARNGLPS